LPEERTARDRLLEEITQERDRLRKGREEAEAHARQMEGLRREAEAVHATAKERAAKQASREAEGLLLELKDARRELERVRRELKSEHDSVNLRALERSVDGAAAAIGVGSSGAEALVRGRRPVDGKALSLESIKPGQQVMLRKLGQVAQVLTVDSRGTLKVAVGPLKMTVDIADVAEARTGENSKARPTPKRVTSPIPSQAVRSQDVTLDLRGQRVEDAFEAVERFIDELLIRDEPVGFVLHGHGTGVLKTAVREYLTQSPYVVQSGPAERDQGGDAFTHFFLKN
jgi:DNA mismatch repair protein MutS2